MVRAGRAVLSGGDPTYLQGAAVPQWDRGGDMKVDLGHSLPPGCSPGPK